VPLNFLAVVGGIIFPGSLLGMTSGQGAIPVFSGTLWAAVTEPSWENLAIAAEAGLGLTGLALFAKRWLRSG